jgi:ComF family protein
MEPRLHNIEPPGPHWLQLARGWLRDVADFCFPNICPACRAVCETGHELCAQCESQIDALAGACACQLCGLSLSYRNAPCPHCVGKGVPHYERIVRLGKFDPPVRALIHRLKYHRAWMVGEMLADRMMREDHVEALLLEADCLLPVPLHAIRQLSRGFNQAEVIAKRLSHLTGIPVAAPVSRSRNTETQTHLHTRAHRMANLKDAFKVIDEAEISGRRVVVVDDVLTTGATLQVLARTLRAAKPASLSALVVAVAEQRVRTVPGSAAPRR